jgi:hypothetical protein
MGDAPDGQSMRPRKRFDFDAAYDFSFRPETYWPDLPSEQGVVSQIKGTARRDIARRALAGEDLPRLEDEELYREAMEFVLQDKLSPEERERWGRINPALMGGEYLPDLEAGDVEIVRIELASVTSDVVQVRARRHADGRLQYLVVDEYDSRYTFTPESSDEPLSFAELIDFVDTAFHEGGWDGDLGLVDGPREANSGGGDPDELVDFVRVSSAFYPQLEEYYAQRAEAWVEQKKLEPPPPPMKPSTREETRAERDAKVADLIRKTGKTYNKTKYTFKELDERTKFLYEDVPNFADASIDEEIGGLFHLPGGDLVQVYYLEVTIYEEAEVNE